MFVKRFVSMGVMYVAEQVLGSRASMGRRASLAFRDCRGIQPLRTEALSLGSGIFMLLRIYGLPG